MKTRYAIAAIALGALLVGSQESPAQSGESASIATGVGMYDAASLLCEYELTEYGAALIAVSQRYQTLAHDEGYRRFHLAFMLDKDMLCDEVVRIDRANSTRMLK